MASGSSPSAALGLASGADGLLTDCEPTIVRTIIRARAASTHQLYSARWRIFSLWCEERGLDPVHCEVLGVLSFLQHLLDSGKVASTLKVYVAAISVHHVQVNGSSLGSHNLVCSFLKGARWLRPAHNPHFPGWNLLLILDFVCLLPFEPLQKTDLKLISLKKVFF